MISSFDELFHIGSSLTTTVACPCCWSSSLCHWSMRPMLFCIGRTSGRHAILLQWSSWFKVEHKTEQAGHVVKTRDERLFYIFRYIVRCAHAVWCATEHCAHTIHGTNIFCSLSTLHPHRMVRHRRFRPQYICLCFPSITCTWEVAYNNTSVTHR